MATRVFVLCAAALMLLTVYNVRGHEDVLCEKTTQCTCQSKKGKIDLWPVGNENPRLTASGSKNSSQFYFNPCTPFTLDECKDVLMCEATEGKRKPHYHPLGYVKDAEFMRMDHQDVLSYSGEGDTEALVYLVCDEDATASSLTLVEKKEGVYSFNLTSPHACYIPPPSSPTPETTTTENSPSTTTENSPSTTTENSPSTTTENSSSTSPGTNSSTTAIPTTNVTTTVSPGPTNDTSTTTPGSGNSTITPTATSIGPDNTTVTLSTDGSTTSAQTTKPSTPTTTASGSFIRFSPTALLLSLPVIALRRV